MTGIRIRTLGGLHIERAGEEIRDLPAQPVRGSLFLYLAVERSATRDRLAELFWPERDAERARHSLSQTLYELRRRLGDDWLETDAERVRVTEVVSVDARDFVTAAEQGRDQEALELYSGAFLDAVHIGTTKAFESWIDRQRSYVTRLYRELCRRATTARVDAHDREGALAVARRWAEADPLEDEAQHRLIELLAETGRRSEALLHYEAYEALIARELEVEPLDETKALVARLREGSAPKTGALGALEPPPSAAAHAGTVGPPPAAQKGRDVPPRRLRRLWWTLPLAAAAAGAIYLGSSSDVPADARTAIAEAALSIAVLPFQNMSPDPEQEYFSDGITEDLITSLSRIEGLRVISRASVMPYKGRDVAPGEIAAALEVKYLLHGSVRRDGNQVRITAQLVDADSDAHLWADSYDRELTGVFEIQSEIAAEIARALEQRLSPEHRSRIAAGGTSSVLAYDMYLRGMGYLNRPGSADVRKFEPAMNFFRRALEVDPEYARAYVGLSSAFRLHIGLSGAIQRDSALAYARRAVSLEPTNPDALAALGAAHVVADELAAAEEMYERALEHDPNNSEAMAGLGRIARRNGRYDEAVRWVARAVSVDPSSSARHAQLGTFLFDLGELTGAQAAYERALDLSPDFPQPAYELAMIHLIRGDQARAEETLREVLRQAPGHPGARSGMGRYLAHIGRYQEAERYLEGPASEENTAASADYRAYIALQTGNQRRAAEILGVLRRELAEREREGLWSHRLRLSVQAMGGDREAALVTFAEVPGAMLRDGPRPLIGLYWIDRDPLLHDITGDPRFQKRLAELRASLDSMRALLPKDPYRVH